MNSEPPHVDSYHTYESNPVPWWIALLWGAYFLFAVSYLVMNLVRG